MSVPPLPAGYEAVRLAGVEAFVWRSALEWLERLLREGATLHEWASRHAVGSHAGRGSVHVVRAVVGGPDGRVAWAVRRYWRGGAAAALLRDRYWGGEPTRPVRELVASVDARQRGLPTPAVIAGAVYRHGTSGSVGLYRADLVTEVVPDARSLAAVILDGDTPTAESLRRAGALVRSLAKAGLAHADLSAGNVVLDAAGGVWVVDLDRARRSRVGSGVAMLSRLERSLRKLARSAGVELDTQAWAALRGGLEGDS